MPWFFPHLTCLLVLFFCLGGCTSPEPPVAPEEPRLRRLTNAQYESSIQDVLGADLFVPSDNEPDYRLRGLLSVGAGSASISPRGVERFEQAAYSVAAQVMEPGVREGLLDCVPAVVADDPCTRSELARLGRSLWRRPLSESELDSAATVAADAGAALADPWDGFEFGLALLLQSPHFLYRVELGHEGISDRFVRAYDDWELASRLSYLLWNTTPDLELLDAAQAGELGDDVGLDIQVERLLASPRSREGMSAWFGDMMQLADLDDLYKDPGVFLHMSDSLGASARGETLQFFEHLAFDQEGDLRDLAISRTTFVNREMAALYEVRAPSLDDFGQVELPADGFRIGLLGQASVLALAAHPVSSSPTLRGQFVREVLLCQTIRAPLAGIDTAIPPLTEEAPTLRDRVAQHLTDPGCAGCHDPMDNIGLGLENFDGIGRFRTMDGGALIDPSGKVDDDTFDDPVGLAQLLRRHDDFAACLVKSFVRYATGAGEGEGQEEGLDWLVYEQDLRQHKLASLISTYVGSAFFRQAGDLVLAPESDLGDEGAADDDDSAGGGGR